MPAGDRAGDDVTPTFDIAALLPGLGVFGGVRRFLELGNELVRRGHRYVLYHPQGQPPDWLPFRGETRPLAALTGARHQVLLCGEPALLQAFRDARADLKLFYCVLEKMQHEGTIARSCDWTLLANSTGIQRRLRRKYGVHAADAIGGINLGVFHPPAQPRQRGPGDPLRILAYGRLSRRRKGVPIVVRAAEMLSRRLSRRWPAWGGSVAHPVTLVLFDHVGPGNEGDPRQHLRARIPCEFHLNLKQELLADLYATCDVFVSAERRAGWNNTVAEAMACGVPVVCTSSGTIDLARHLETACIVRWRHAFFFARALAGMSADAALRARLRGAALAHVAAYAWPRVADRFEAIVREKLGIARPDA
jgi:glycosyltransferase involved in cell wall biosynthesis